MYICIFVYMYICIYTPTYYIPCEDPYTSRFQKPWFAGALRPEGSKFIPSQVEGI